MKLVLIGIQGAGKSTQGNLLSGQLKVPYLSTGHIFREIAKEKTNLGRYVKETINAGFLIPDDKTIEIVNEYLSKPEYKHGYILDGFPRTLNQVKKFKNSVDKVIYLKISDKEVLWRLAGRNDNSRKDETLPALKKRMELFHKHTDHVIEYYKKNGKLALIDATKSIKEVNQEILKFVGRQLIKNQIRGWERKQKTIVAIVGLPGAGKTEAAKFFREKKLPVISFGHIVVDYIEKKKWPHTEEVHKKVREEFRQRYGKKVMAYLNLKRIKKALSKNLLVVVDGMRSWEEYTFLKEKLPHLRLIVLTLYAGKHIRYQRIQHRKERSRLFGEQRDIDELLGTNMGPTIAYCDFLIINNLSLEDFHNRLEEVYRQAYFS
jgi:adenylate kinase